MLQSKGSTKLEFNNNYIKVKMNLHNFLINTPVHHKTTRDLMKKLIC